MIYIGLLYGKYMTDVSCWPEFIEKVTKSFEEDGWGQKVKSYNDTRIVVPINEYQIGNMLGMFVKMMKQNEARTESWNTGDWFHEVLSILCEAMVKLEIKEVGANCFVYPFVTEELQKVGWDFLRYDKIKTEEYNERMERLQQSRSGQIPY